jgi:hypothetical protein
VSIKRPVTDFDGGSHSYSKDGEKLAGVSTVAKIGEDEVWGIASAWGFRIGYEGAYEVLHKNRGQWPENPDALRALLQKAGLTPWSKRDAAGERGNWVHDVLEGLGQRGDIPDLDKFTEEVQGHVRAVLQWFLDFRPKFVANEVQVVSERHGFAGRYDLRAMIEARRLIGLAHPFKDLFKDHDSPQAARVWELAKKGLEALTLDDLKTSKSVYPTSHFVQLSGYELASVEMGFPATDAQFNLNTHADGTYDFVPSWSLAQDFIDYLGASNAVKRIKRSDPALRRKARQEQALMALMPDDFTVLLEGVDLDRGPLVGMLKDLKKRGLIEQVKGTWTVRHLQPTVA